MADEEKNDGGGANEFKDERKKAKEKGPSFYLILILVLNLVIISGVYGIVIYVKFFTQKEKLQEDAEFEKIVEKDKDEALGPIYTFEQFKVNLESPGGRTMVKAVIELEFFDEESLTEAEVITSRIRNIVINLLSSKKKSDLISVRGKLFLRDQIMRSINARLKKGGVKYVYFSKFVIQ
jgi:flagellar FliL protein